MRFIGYGAMLTESFVAVMALITACDHQPGVYFTMNAPAARAGHRGERCEDVNGMGFRGDAGDADRAAAQAVGEKTIVSRTGGAPTLAFGMAQILQRSIRRRRPEGVLVPLRDHVRGAVHPDRGRRGTRAGRFMLQDLLGTSPSVVASAPSRLPANLIASALCVGGLGHFLYQGVIDPLGGINTLWPLFGIANQMLAAIALVLGTVVLFKMKRERYAWVTIVPTVWLLICTLTAGWQKIFDANPKVSFLAHAAKLQAALDEGKVLAPAKSLAQMKRIIFNDYVDATLAGLFMFVVLSIAVYGVLAVLRARRAAKPTSRETPFEPMPAGQALGSGR